jgi:alkylation response protein AidB-like acyl-CoA dehydrogenase
MSAPGTTSILNPPRLPRTREERIERLVGEKLRPLAVAIDRDGYYPSEFLGEFGAEGGFVRTGAGLGEAVSATAVVSRACGSTGFLTWCQNASIWYLLNSENSSLRSARLESLAAGRLLGATGLSNAVKSLAGIELLRLRGVREAAGYRVSGTLPWVSNLGPGHGCAVAFSVSDSSALAFLDCSWPGVRLLPTAPFAALEGTATFALRLDGVLVPDDAVLAVPAGPFLCRVQPGFVLLQVGLGVGIARGAIDDMRAADRSLGASNRHLPDRPDGLEEELDRLWAQTERLARIEGPALDGRLREILRVRLEVAELALRASQAAVLHAGALGFIATAAPQRRLREAMFFCILTPSTKHLRRLLEAPQGDSNIGDHA